MTMFKVELMMTMHRYYGCYKSSTKLFVEIYNDDPLFLILEGHEKKKA